MATYPYRSGTSNEDELISLMLEWKWWDKTVEEINSLIPILTSSDMDAVKKKIISYIDNK